MMLSRSQSRQKSEEGKATASVIGLVRSLSMATEVPTLSNVDNTLDSGRWRRNWVGQLNDRIEAETSHLTSSAERPQPLQSSRSCRPQAVIATGRRCLSRNRVEVCSRPE